MSATLSRIQRRDWLRMLAAGFSTTSLSGWLPALAREVGAAGEAGSLPRTSGACILLWMPGGPSQLDTFDPKPEHANGGEFAAIQTSVPGIQIAEHLPQVAAEMDHLAIVRSLKTKEGDHGRATYHLRTGYRPEGALQYPTLGSLLGNEFELNRAGVPNYVSILPNTFLNPAAFGPGFLGPSRAPLVVGGTPVNQRGDDTEEYGPPLEVRNVRLPEQIDALRADARLKLLAQQESRFVNERPGLPTESHRSAYRNARQMMESSAMQAFNLEEEPVALREAYGKNRFGQGCLLARRLVERGVPFVEVALGGPNGEMQIGWDTHQDNFTSVRQLCETLDPAWGTLLRDLRDRGLLETTTVVWMGEFGRTPVINAQVGRDHFPNAWSAVLGGGGIRGGQAYGATDAAGMEVSEHPVEVSQFLATIMAAMEIDCDGHNVSSVGRPIRFAEAPGQPIQELLV